MKVVCIIFSYYCYWTHLIVPVCVCVRVCVIFNFRFSILCWQLAGQMRDFVYRMCAP